MENEPKKHFFLFKHIFNSIFLLCQRQFFHKFELVDQQRMVDNPNRKNLNNS
jgi:hypothetical protein